MAYFITGYYTNNSITNTSTQQITETGNNPAPSHAAMIPAISATSPEMGLGGVDDGREGHDCQRDVRYIVQKGLNELIFNGFADQRQG